MMKKSIFAALCCLMLGAMPFNAMARDVPSSAHEGIKAKIINPAPENFTINVRSLSNWGANQDAETFAVYISSRKPETCGDFRHLKLKYEKPKKYRRQFDLSNHPEVLDALEKYKCVVIRNIPSDSG